MQFPATLVFGGRNPPPHPLGTGKFFRLALSIACNFQQLWFLVAEKFPPRNREIFLDWLYPFHAILSNFGFLVAESSHPHPPPPGTGKFFYSGSIHFMQFPATLVFGGRTACPPPPRTGETFKLDLSISCNFQQLWFLVAESSPPPQEQGNFFYTGSIYFMQFPATLVFGGRKAPPPPGTGNFFF